MNNENAADLYAKFEKSVPKNKRESLKQSLEEADNEKLEGLEKLKFGANAKHRRLDLLICIVATLLSAVFLVFNLIVFMSVKPNYDKYGEIATKVGDDLQDFVTTEKVTYAATAEDDKILQDILYPMYGEYKQIFDTYNQCATEYGNKVKEYNEAYTAYVADYTYVNDKSGNYLKHKTNLALLIEPEQGVDGYDELKEQYDKTKESYEKSIKEYEDKATGVAAKLATVEELLNAIPELATAYSDALNAITPVIVGYNNGLNYAEKVYAYGNLNGFNDQTLGKYINRINAELASYQSAYKSSYDSYKTFKKLDENLPSIKTADEAAYAGIYADYQAAKTDLKAFVSDYVDLQKEYETYVKDNKATYDADKKEYEQYKKDNADKVGTAEYNTAVATYEAKLKVYEDKVSDYTVKLGYKDRVCKAYNLTSYYQFMLTYKATAADKITEAQTKQLQQYEAKLTVYATVAAWTDEEYVTNFVAHNALVKEQSDYTENNKSDADYQDKLKDYQNRVAESKEKLDLYNILANVDCDLGGRHNEKDSVLKDTFNDSDYGVKILSSEYDSANAYFATEQMSIKLEYVLNRASDTIGAAADYCNTVNDNEELDRLDWLTFSVSQGKKVLKDIGHADLTTHINGYLEGLQKYDLKTDRFADFDISKNQVDDIKTVVNGLAYNGQGEGYDTVYVKLNSSITTANEKYKDYHTVGSSLSTIVMVYDIILIVAFAAYFAYGMVMRVVDEKEENYNLIIEYLA